MIYRCHFIEITEGVVPGTKRKCRCVVCGRLTAPTSSPVELIFAKCRAIDANRESQLLTSLPAETRVLIGDRVADVLKKFGIPPCNSCEKRKQWLNRLHLWLTG